MDSLLNSSLVVALIIGGLTTGTALVGFILRQLFVGHSSLKVLTASLEEHIKADEISFNRAYKSDERLYGEVKAMREGFNSMKVTLERLATTTDMLLRPWEGRAERRVEDYS